jgi:hypothetical protein
VQDVPEVPNGSALTGDSTVLYYENFDCFGPQLVLSEPASNGRRSSTVTNDGAGTYSVRFPAGPPSTKTIGAHSTSSDGTGCLPFAPPKPLSVATPTNPVTFVRPFRVVVE